MSIIAALKCLNKDGNIKLNKAAKIQ